ncbi:MAG: Na+/H+ antiporter subunit E [Chloroflexota bacterium]
MVLLNVFMALAWVALTGEFTPGNFVTGLVLAYLVLVLTEVTTGRQTGYVQRVWLLVKFIAFFLKELVLSTLRVARWVLTPRLTMRPAVVAVPLTITTDAQITLLGNMITLTPGTLTLDVAGDQSCIYVHVFNVDDIEAFRDEIKQGFERRILEVWDAWNW